MGYSPCSGWIWSIFFLLSVSVLSHTFTLESSMLDCGFGRLKFNDYHIFCCLFWVCNSFKLWNAHECPRSTWSFGSFHTIISLILISFRYSNVCYIDPKSVLLDCFWNHFHQFGGFLCCTKPYFLVSCSSPLGKNFDPLSILLRYFGIVETLHWSFLLNFFYFSKSGFPFTLCFGFLFEQVLNSCDWILGACFLHRI
jgi:hypothetical protein